MNMNSTLLLLQSISQNMALFCCALFAGGSIYISLVEDPAIAEGGTDLANTYRLIAHPRPAIVQCGFASIAALAGLVHAWSGGSIWWGIGGIILALCALIHLLVIVPATRDLADAARLDDPPQALAAFRHIARLHAGISLASLVALAVFILRT